MSSGLQVLIALASCPFPYLVACRIKSGFAYSLPVNRQHPLWRRYPLPTKMVVHGISPLIRTSHAVSPRACLDHIPITTLRMTSQATLRPLRDSQKDVGYKAHSRVPIVYGCDGRLQREPAKSPKRQTVVGELGSANSRATLCARFWPDTGARPEMEVRMA